MGKLVQIKLGGYRQVEWYDLNAVECQRHDFVILEVDRGSEYGQIISDVEKACAGKTDNAKGQVIRVATDGDLKQIENNRMKSRDALKICEEKITDRRLDMRLVNCEYTFDSSKVIFYFNSDGRVDFRQLVKDLARVFRVRIELKQIGVRDKAKIIGGYGVCGRELCCSSYMNSFHPLSIKMAKEQGLPLNPSRISGVCGRIKCCMAYEFQVYKQYSRNLPKVGDRVDTPEGKGKVVDVNILKRLAHVDLGDGKYIKKSFETRTTPAPN